MRTCGVCVADLRATYTNGDRGGWFRLRWLGVYGVMVGEARLAAANRGGKRQGGRMSEQAYSGCAGHQAVSVTPRFEVPNRGHSWKTMASIN